MTAALIEPLAMVTRALRRLRLADHRLVLISGDGSTGLLALMVLRHAGIEQIAMIGGREGRLALARDLGAAATFNFLWLGAGARNEAVHLAVEERLPLERLISHSFPAEHFEAAFALIHRQHDVVKVLLKW